MTLDAHYALAIDLGTSRTAAATARRAADGGIVAASLPLGRRSDSVETAVFVTEDGDLLFGEAALRRGLTRPDRLLREFKRRVGDDVPLTVAGSSYPAHALYADMIAWVVEVAREREGRSPDATAVTHPTSWGAHRLDLVRDALARLGVADVVLIGEPEAAARHYEATHPLEAGQSLAVYDLGGGTFDAVVLRKSDDGGLVPAGRSVGIGDLGGADFDDAVMRHVLASANLADALPSADDPDSRLALAQLRRECVEAKEALSFDAEAVVPVLIAGHGSSVRLVRSELESMIDGQLERTVDALEEAIGDEAADVQAILLTGGSSRIPRVAQLLSERFDLPIAIDADPKAVVPLGAARTALRTLFAADEEAAAIAAATAAAAALAALPAPGSARKGAKAPRMSKSAKAAAAAAAAAAAVQADAAHAAVQPAGAVTLAPPTGAAVMAPPPSGALVPAPAAAAPPVPFAAPAPAPAPAPTHAPAKPSGLRRKLGIAMVAGSALAGVAIVMFTAFPLASGGTPPAQSAETENTPTPSASAPAPADPAAAPAPAVDPSTGAADDGDDDGGSGPLLRKNTATTPRRDAAPEAPNQAAAPPAPSSEHVSPRPTTTPDPEPSSPSDPEPGPAADPEHPSPRPTTDPEPPAPDEPSHPTPRPSTDPEPEPSTPSDPDPGTPTNPEPDPSTPSNPDPDPGTPSDPPAEQASQPPADPPAEEPSEQPSEPPAEQPSEEPSQPPAEQPSDTPSEPPAEIL